MRPKITFAILILCAASGCWREVEYTAPEPTSNSEKQAPVVSEQVTASNEPPTPVTPAISSAEDDSQAAAGEFGDDLAATLAAEEPPAQSSEPAATTPIAESTPPPTPNVGDRYAITTPAATPPAEPVGLTNSPPATDTVDSLFDEPVDPDTPPDSPVNDSMLPEEREAIAETSDAPIPNLDDDDIQTPPAVQAWNTRRAAWLLGSKLSLAVLANEHGATAEEVQKFLGQSRALAEKLDVTVPNLPARPAAGAARGATDPALDYLFTQGQEIGRELANRQGPDRAALFEVAVKSNILLVLYKPDAPTAEAIAKAIEQAGQRAKLPGTLWQPLLDTLAAKASLADVRAAVYRLHAEADKYLDETAQR